MNPIEISINWISPIIIKIKNMNQEDFLAFFRKTKCVIDDAVSMQGFIGLGTFLTYFEEYKNIVFSDYTKECLESDGFKHYVFHMMCMTVHLDQQIPKEKKPVEKKAVQSNVINFYDYRIKKLAN